MRLAFTGGNDELEMCFATCICVGILDLPWPTTIKCIAATGCQRGGRFRVSTRQWRTRVAIP